MGDDWVDSRIGWTISSDEEAAGWELDLDGSQDFILTQQDHDDNGDELALYSDYDDEEAAGKQELDLETELEWAQPQEWHRAESAAEQNVGDELGRLQESSQDWQQCGAHAACSSSSTMAEIASMPQHQGSPCPSQICLLGRACSRSRSRSRSGDVRSRRLVFVAIVFLAVWQMLCTYQILARSGGRRLHLMSSCSTV